MMSRKKLGIAASLMMILSSVNVEARTIIDMPNDWSRLPLENGIKNGLFQGTEKGLINAKNNLNKAEMATIMNRVLSLTEKADLKEYSDMFKSSWYYEEIAKSVEAELMAGGGSGKNKKMAPENLVTREEAFTIIARAMNLKSESGFGRDFDDANEISYWAQSAIGGLSEKGYIEGYKGKINPKGYITRAEFAKVLDNTFKDYIRNPGTYTEVVSGNIVINSPDVELKNLIIAGDLIISEGALDGKINLNNVGITGRIVVRGSDRLVLEEGSNTNYILVDNKSNNFKIDIESDSRVELLILKSKTSIDGYGHLRDIEAKEGSDGSRVYIMNTNIDIDSGVRGIRDRLGVVIRPGSDMDINKDTEKVHSEALADLRDLKYQARLLNDREVNKALAKVELVNKDSSLREIQDAVRSLEKEIKDLEDKEARRQDYYNKLESLRAEASELKFEEVGPILSKYAGVDIRSNIRLLIDAVDEIEEVLTRGKQILAAKEKKYSQLEVLRKRAEAINDSELTTIVGRYNHLSQESTLEDLKEAIEVIEKDLERIEKEKEEKEHEKAFIRLETLMGEAEKAIDRSENYEVEDKDKTDAEIKEEIRKIKKADIDKLKKDYGELTIESDKTEIDKALAELEETIKKADKGLARQKDAHKILEDYRKEASQTKRDSYKNKVNEYSKLDKDSMVFDLEEAVEEIKNFRESQFSELVRKLDNYEKSINTIITKSVTGENKKPTEAEVKFLVEDNLDIQDKGRITVDSVVIKEEGQTIKIRVNLKEDIIVREIKIEDIELKNE